MNKVKYVATKRISLSALIGWGFAAWSTGALAVPVAQLDVSGGTWDPVTQTIVTSDSAFTLYGYGNTPAGNGKALDRTLSWYLSIALVPQSPAGTNFGSFTVNGVSYDTSNFVYGVPPLESNLAFQAGDLSQHGIYPTLFTALGVNWNTAQTRASVDVQSNPGTSPTANPGTAMMWQGWNFNVAGLLPGFNLHFDLFGVTCKTTTPTIRQLGTTDCTVKQFAPFSHDAETTQVPEPATALLLGAGLFLVGVAVRRRRPVPAAG